MMHIYLPLTIMPNSSNVYYPTNTGIKDLEMLVRLQPHDYNTTIVKELYYKTCMTIKGNFPR